MIAFLEDILTGASLAGFAFVTVMFVVRVVVHIRRNRKRRANQWFMAGYRAGHRHASASTADRGRHSS